MQFRRNIIQFHIMPRTIVVVARSRQPLGVYGTVFDDQRDYTSSDSALPVKSHMCVYVQKIRIDELLGGLL